MIHAILPVVGRRVIALSDVYLNDEKIFNKNDVFTITSVKPSEGKTDSGILIALGGHRLMFDANVTYLVDNNPNT